MSVITRIQKVSIGIASGSTSNTATITSVNTANTLIIFNGNQTSQATATNINSCVARVTLTDATTVTATRGASNTDTVTIRCTVIEFSTGVNSIQYGTVSIAAASTSGTATISSVGSNAFIHWLGSSITTASSSYSNSQAILSFSGTTVTATTGSAFADMVIGFVVCDLSTSILDSVNKYTLTDTSTNSSYTKTVTSIDPTQSIIIRAGENNANAGAAATNTAHTLDLTNSTTVTATRNGTNGSTRTINFWVVEFAAGVLSSNGVQRGDITLASATSNAATLANALPSATSCVNYCGFLSGGTPRTYFSTLLISTLVNTTVTAGVNTAGSPTVSYEAIDFNAFTPGHVNLGQVIPGAIT